MAEGARRLDNLETGAFAQSRSDSLIVRTLSGWTNVLGSQAAFFGAGGNDYTPQGQAPQPQVAVNVDMTNTIVGDDDLINRMVRTIQDAFSRASAGEVS